MSAPPGDPGATVGLESAAAELAAVLRPSLLRLTRMIRNQRVDTSITLTQISAMGTLWKNGPMSAGELAAQERVQPPSMTKVLATLEERGLVRRETHPADRRQAIVSVTDAGIALLDSERRSRDLWLSRRLAALSDDQRRMLRDVVPVLDALADQ